MRKPIFPVILSGGSGSRLWPVSRESHPKQLLPMIGETTLLQQTAYRVSDPELFQPLTVIANSEHRFQVAEQLRDIGLSDVRIVLEPEARGTAAAIAAAAALVGEEQPDALLLVMPADHYIGDAAAFAAAVAQAAPAAEAGGLVLFGVRPTRPATGFGYIRAGSSIGDGVRSVLAFVEKPNIDKARNFLECGDHFWNAGLFLFSVSAIREELGRYEPDILLCSEQAVRNSSQDLDFLRLAPEPFSRCPSTSIDYAVFERTSRAILLPVEFEWTDVGSWGALWEQASKNETENVFVGNVQAHDTSGSYLRSEGPLIATIGVQNLVVVATDDAVLIADRSCDQDVKRVVDHLRKVNCPTATQNRKVYRPWGWYETLEVGHRFQVKRLTVKPGGVLSLQKHFHRAEHWIVVEGTALAQVDGVERLIAENQSIHVPLGAVHRLSNPGKTPLALIEVQSGGYLGEDDIVRYEDVYARA